MNHTAFEVTGRRVIVTGAAMGIGRAISRRFAEAGAQVLMVDRDQAALAESAASIDAPADRVARLVCDISTDAAPATILERCVEVFGGVEVLVNNAGIYPQVPMLEMTPERFDQVYRVNLRALAFLSQAVGRQMVKQGAGGRIINIGSVDSLHPSMVGLAAYDASKGGVLMFTRSFALEMAPHGVAVNAILPGGVTTEGTARPLEGSGMTDEQLVAMQRRYVETKIPMKRMGVPDDIAHVALFMASPAAAYITGAHLVVDGGMLLT